MEKNNNFSLIYQSIFYWYLTIISHINLVSSRISYTIILAFEKQMRRDAAIELSELLVELVDFRLVIENDYIHSFGPNNTFLKLQNLKDCPLTLPYMVPSLLNILAV